MSFASYTAPVNRLGLTLFLAMALHAFLILGVTFNIEKLKSDPPPDRTLEILVVRQPNLPKKPEQADFLAQTNQQGGGTVEEKVRPTTRDTRPAPVPSPVPATETRLSPPPAPAAQKPKSVVTSKAPAEKRSGSPLKAHLYLSKRRPPALHNCWPAPSGKSIGSLRNSIARQTPMPKGRGENLSVPVPRNTNTPAIWMPGEKRSNASAI